MRYFIQTLFLLVPVLGLNNEPSLFKNDERLKLNLKPYSTSCLFKTTDPKTSTFIDSASIKQSDWYAQAMKAIEESEYEIKSDTGNKTFASPNRKNDLRTLYSNDALTLTPRNYSAGRWKLTLQLKGVYAGKEKLYGLANDPAITNNGNDLRFDNNGQFVTEYINSKEGVRQNFIINQKPSGGAKTISVKLEAGKDWFLNKVGDKEIHFAKAKKTGYDKKITYSGLKVWDADNKELEASFTVNENKISIDVNTTGAVYPVTIDPLSATPAALLESNQVNAQMGFSVAGAGDVNGDGYSDVIVGARSYDNGQTDEGAAFVYHGSITGIATIAQTQIESNQANAELGFFVSGAGDVNGDGFSDVIVGAPQYDNGQIDEGAAFVYHGSINGIIATVQTQLEVNQVGAYMGMSVACAGDVNGDGYSDVIVGAHLYDNGQTDEGAAFVYLGSAAGISTTIQAQLEGNQTAANMAISVASAGDVNGDGFSDVIVGAFSYDNGQTDEGAAFVYHGSASGINPVIQAQLECNQANALMGVSVASAGDVNGDGYSDVIVGAYYFDAGQVNEGVAFIFHGSAAGISSTIATQLECSQANANMGGSVACAGDINGDGYSDVIVGAYIYNGGQVNEGAVFLFQGSVTGVNTSIATQLESNQANSFMGISVASAGDVNGDGLSDIIVGAYIYDNGQMDEGAAFVYQGSPDGLSASSNWSSESNQANAYAGISVASAGDINSDGYSDVIVGAYIYDQGFTDNGKAYLYLGTATGLSVTPAWTAIGSMANEYFGRCVAAAGDVNGDGYGDVLVGAYGYSNGESQEGRAYLFYGSATGLAVGAGWTTESNVANGIMGLSVASAGDVNGDGYSDIIIGAPQYNNGNINEGKVFLFYGAATGPAVIADWAVESNQNGEQFGISVASLGDVNGDGYSDVIVGGYLYDGGLTDEGGAFAYYGSPTGLPATPDWTSKGNQLNAQFGISVASAGDVNGDGYTDAIVGSYLYDNGQTDEGAAFVYYGSATGLSAAANWTAESNMASSFYAYSVSSAGDVNGDGYSDVIVGARNYANGQVDEGALYVYHGSPTGLSATSNWLFESNNAGIILGNSVACAGDVNGDGYSDVIAGAPYFTNGQVKEGAAFTYYGNNGGGLRNNLKLYNTDLVTPIQRSNILVPNLFGAGIFARSPLGKAKGKMVWEVKKQGQAFSGEPIANSTSFLDKQTFYTDLGIAGVELKYQVQKLYFQNKVRVRVEYDKATAITGQIYGPWRYPAGYLQGVQGMNSLPLPVTLLRFTARIIDDNDIALNWVTATELNMKTYTIERSTDAVHFITVGIKTATGTSLSQNEYNFVDTNGFHQSAVLYYKLKLLEVNGTVSYTKTVTLAKKKQVGNYVYPNPIVKGKDANIVIQSRQNNNLFSFTVIDVSGKKLLQQTRSLHIGKNEITINTNNLSRGIYFIIVKVAGEQERYPLMIQ